MSNNEIESFVQKGKKPREELRLPQLHYVVVDDWINKLGEKTFCHWLKLLSLVNRKEEAEEIYGNKSTVPRSLEDLYTNIFEMSKSTFFRTVIHPLWNFGLIDIVEWSNSKKNGTKPKNIIVYEYPQNSYELAVKPLVKCRDYQKEYTSNSAIFGRSGAKLRKEESELKKQEDEDESNRFKNETLDENSDKDKNVDKSNRFKNETLTVSKMKPYTVSKMKPINYSNTLVNYSNTLVNEKNLSIEDEIKKLNITPSIKKLLIKKIDRLILFKIDLLEIETLFKTYDLADYHFRDVLEDVLNSDIETSFKKYMKKALDNYIKNKTAISDNMKTNARQSKEPSWLTKKENNTKKENKDNEGNIFTKIEALLKIYENFPDKLSETDKSLLRENRAIVEVIFRKTVNL